ncbi:hypothetical protein F4692_001049 [Nocardioides cavernae]|uniref:Uncharacterized protein n=1 Tax=Nocardioides cavernae TaxID=1921566 RepID=A0A7Y9H0X5_9ACTN|nr:hypothetical protein [Nocardioides cavernae]NYE35945.1 hypothetical protein [Nocardioides cavernae]
MPANPWELRADVRPLEAAAQRWTEISEVMARRGDDLVDAARRATEGWDAGAAESYEQHRRQVLANLDRFTSLATQIAGSLRAVSAVITSSQKELDQNWAKVAMIPHEVVGESRHLVFKPSEDDERGKVTQGQAESEEIRRRLTLSLDQESTRLRAARAEFVIVRTELMTLTGSRFPGFAAPGQDESGVGTVPAISTSVPGSAQGGVSGVGGLAPIGPISVSMPDLQGLSGLGPIAATAAAGLMGRRGTTRTSTTATPPIGGMGGGAMAARAGTMSRGMASGRSGSRMAAPKLERTSSEETAARAAREKETLREAKRAALEEKRAERAARKAEREAERQAGRDPGRDKDRDRDKRKDPRDEERDERDADLDAELDGEAGDGTADVDPDVEAERPPAIVVVHEPTPGGHAGEPRR